MSTNLKLISWNIDSLNAALAGKSARSALTMAVINKIAERKPDLLAIQETKLPLEEKKADAILDAFMEHFPDHQMHYVKSVPPARKGYAGTLMLWKKELDAVKTNGPTIGAPETMDSEGRIITVEFPQFYVTTVYTPNSGDGLVRLPQRGQWDDQFRAYLQELDTEKPVLVCGDFNVAHQEIDLARPASNHQSAGFTDQEREKFGLLLDAGFVDSFRHLHPDAEGFYEEDGKKLSSYTWFAQMVRAAKPNNSGWRIDYWLASQRLVDAGALVSCGPIDTGERRDHSPLELTIAL